MNNIMFNICLLMNALSDGFKSEVKENARKLRSLGFPVPSFNMKVMVGQYHWPISNLKMTVSHTLNHVIRDSLKNHRSISWSDGYRMICNTCKNNGVESWYPKDMSDCRICRTPSYWNSVREWGFRNGETAQYEPSIVGMLGFRLLPRTTAKTVQSWRDGRIGLMTIKLRKGMLRNGLNAKSYQYSGLKVSHQFLTALENLGHHDEASWYRDNKMGCQVWREVIFFDYVHPSDNSCYQEGFADIAFKNQIEESGLKTRSHPRISQE